jgi:hypothetical protein
MARKPFSVRIIEMRKQRYIETVYRDGEVVLTLIDPLQKPARRPRRPFARVVDYSQKKEKLCAEPATDEAIKTLER